MIALVSAVAILVVLSALYLLRPTGRVELLGPFGIFSLSFALVYFLVPAVQSLWPTDNSLYATGLGSSTDIPVAIALALCYYLAVLTAYTLGNPRPQDPRVLRRAAAIASREEAGLIFALVLLQLYSATRIWQLVSPYLGANYSQFIIDRIALSAGQGYGLAPILAGIPAALLVTAPSLAVRSRRRPRRPIALALGILSLTAAASGLLGRRIDMLVGFVWLALSAMLLSGRTRVRVSKLLAILAAVLVSVTVLGTIRANIQHGNTSDGFTFRDSDFFVRKIIAETALNFGQLEWLAVVRMKRSQWDFQYGRTYVAAALMPVPRSRWPEKPLGAGPMLANIIRPGAFDLQRGASSSTTPGCVTEAYLNGGTCAVLFVGALHGAALAILTQYGSRISVRRQYVSYLLYTFFLSLSLVYGEFSGNFVRIGVLLAPVLAYIRIRALLSKSGTKPPAPCRLAGTSRPVQL